MVHRSTQVVDPPVDTDEHFVEMPPVAGSRAPTTEIVGEGLTELQAPLTDSLIGECDAAHPHHLFDIAITESETKVEPHAMADDFSRKNDGGGRGRRRGASAEYAACTVILHLQLLNLTIPSPVAVIVCALSRSHDSCRRLLFFLAFNW